MNAVGNSYLCPSCGREITGKYCANCGEKKMTHHDLSIKHFIEESVESFIHFDNKFFRSVKLLFTQPGALTIHFEQGRKVPFMKPVQLFVICNLLFFLLVGGMNVFSVPLKNFLSYTNYINNGTLNTFTSKFGSGADIYQISLLFDEKMMSQSKAFIFLFIPFFALACVLLFFRKKKYLTLHLVFSTHFFSFLLIFFILFHFLFEIPNRYLFHISYDTFDNIAVLINVSVLILYFSIAAKRFYKVKWLTAIIAGLFAGFLFINLLQGYRLLLFNKIIHSLS